MMINPELKKTLNPKSESYQPIKELIVNYVGSKVLANTSEELSVTVEMIIQVLAEEFPELVLCLAEENFLRGYEQAFVDLGYESK